MLDSEIQQVLNLHLKEKNVNVHKYLKEILYDACTIDDGRGYSPLDPIVHEILAKGVRTDLRDAEQLARNMLSKLF